VRHRPLVSLTLALAAGAPASALQRGFEARTSLRLFAGAAVSQRLLWSLARQPILIPGTAYLCSTIQGQQHGLGLALLGFQALVRPIPRAAVNPVVHFGVLAASYTASTVYLEGAYPNGIFDVSNPWLGFPAVAAPADGRAHAPTSTHYTSHFVVALGLDFVLDGRRGRRY
jgi:hypothetical protein